MASLPVALCHCRPIPTDRPPRRSAGRRPSLPSLSASFFLSFFPFYPFSSNLRTQRLWPQGGGVAGPLNRPTPYRTLPWRRWGPPPAPPWPEGPARSRQAQTNAAPSQLIRPSSNRRSPSPPSSEASVRERGGPRLSVAATAMPKPRPTPLLSLPPPFHTLLPPSLSSLIGGWRGLPTATTTRRWGLEIIEGRG